MQKVDLLGGKQALNARKPSLHKIAVVERFVTKDALGGERRFFSIGHLGTVEHAVLPEGKRHHFVRIGATSELGRYFVGGELGGRPGYNQGDALVFRDSLA